MKPTLAWLALALAGLLDVAWALTMKQAQGWTRPGWSLLSVLLLALFVWLLGRALQVLPLGPAYAAWTGIGAVGTVAAGWCWFDEALSVPAACGVLLVVTGIVVLRLAAS